MQHRLCNFTPLLALSPAPLPPPSHRLSEHKKKEDTHKHECASQTASHTLRSCSCFLLSVVCFLFFITKTHGTHVQHTTCGADVRVSQRTFVLWFHSTRYSDPLQRLFQTTPARIVEARWLQSLKPRTTSQQGFQWKRCQLPADGIV